MCSLGAAKRNPGYVLLFKHISLAQQRVLGPVDLGGEVIAATAVGVHFLHHALVRHDDFFPACIGFYTQDFWSFFPDWPCRRIAGRTDGYCFVYIAA